MAGGTGEAILKCQSRRSVALHHKSVNLIVQLIATTYNTTQVAHTAMWSSAITTHTGDDRNVHCYERGLLCLSHLGNTSQFAFN